MFQVIFILIIAGSVAILIPHWQLMRRLTRVESAFVKLEDALRERMDLILEKLTHIEDAGKIKEICETARDAETSELLKAYAKIIKTPLFEELGALADEEDFNRLREDYNKETEPYNSMIGKFPWKIYSNAGKASYDSIT